MVQELQRQLMLDSIAVQREMLSKLESLGAKIDASADKTHANTEAIQELQKNLSNGVMGKLCKKVEGIYIAIIGLLVPIIWILINALKDVPK